MDIKPRKCKQCGEIKPLEQYRKYYGGRKGRYRTCLTCEKVNTRYKYLNRKEATKGLTDTDAAEKHKIEELYELQRSRGLQPPGKATNDALNLDELLNKNRAAVEEVKAAAPEVSGDTPAELLEWLTKDLTSYSPEYLQDEIADALLEKYRPQTGVDPKLLTPVYDQKYRDIINKILKRFDDYEDEYYNE